MIIKKLISFKKKLKKKKLDLHTPYFQELDFSYLKQCIKSTFVSTQSGSFIKRLKSENKREGARLAVDLAKERNKATKDGTKLAIELNESLKDG